MATAGGLGFKRCGALFIGRLRRSWAGVPERDSGEDRGVTGMAGVREESGRRGMTGGPVASEAGRRARVRARWADGRRPSGPRALVRADRSAG